MKLKRILPFMLVGALALNLTACNEKDPVTPVTPSDDKVLTGDITADKTLTAETWTLKGYVYVKEGATLTIPAGAIIKSDIIDKGALIIERGAKIMAEGTASNPIVFTSGVTMGQRRPGDWGGIIILGKAKTNRATEPTIEGGVGKQYGGQDDADNSGVMKYVRIEYAGIAAEPGSEINGLTFGGVGNGTVIENIMVSYGNDDAYEFFGGTVNCKNLIAFSSLDDDFDFDYGYRGTITGGISFKNPAFADPGDASNGVEADNDGTGTNATPNTHPVLRNFTFVGPIAPGSTALVQANHNLGNRWRRNVEFEVYNSIYMGHNKGEFSMESSGTIDKYFNGTSKFENNLVDGTTKPFISKDGADGKKDADLKAMALTKGCEEVADANAIGLVKPFDTKAPNFAPTAGGKAATKGVGAITGTDWTSGWASWDPNSNEY